jgi:hypothetical protein
MTVITSVSSVNSLAVWRNTSTRRSRCSHPRGGAVHGSSLALIASASSRRSRCSHPRGGAVHGSSLALIASDANTPAGGCPPIRGRSHCCKARAASGQPDALCVFRDGSLVFAAVCWGRLAGARHPDCVVWGSGSGQRFGRTELAGARRPDCVISGSRFGQRSDRTRDSRRATRCSARPSAAAPHAPRRCRRGRSGWPSSSSTRWARRTPGRPIARAPSSSAAAASAPGPMPPLR